MAVVGDELIEISLLDDFSLEDGANARIIAQPIGDLAD